MHVNREPLNKEDVMKTITKALFAMEVIVTLVCASALYLLIWIEYSAVTSVIKILGLL